MTKGFKKHKYINYIYKKYYYNDKDYNTHGHYMYSKGGYYVIANFKNGDLNGIYINITAH